MELILILLLFIYYTTQIVEPHSMLNHASMDVENIISIMIPENSRTNINIDQLTLDLRRQLERIKLNQILKSDYKSVISNNKLSDFTNNKNQEAKSVGFFGKAYQGKINYYYYIPQIFKTKTNLRNLKKKIRGYQRYLSSSEENKKNFKRHNRIKIHVDKKIKTEKLKKNPKTSFTHRNFHQFRKFDNSLDDDDIDINLEKYSSHEKNFLKGWIQDGAAEEYINKINQIDDSSVNYKNNDQQNVQSVEPRVESSCLVVNNKGNKQENIKEVFTNELDKNNAISNDCAEEIDADGQVISSCFNESTTNTLESTKSNNEEEINFVNKEKNDDAINNVNVNETINNNVYNTVKQKLYPINIQVEDFREVEQILQNPEDIIDQFNSSSTENDIKIDGDDNSLNANFEVNDNLQNTVLLTSMNQDSHSSIVDNDSKGDDINSLYEYVDKNRNLIDDKEPTSVTHRATYQSGMQNISNRNDKNVKIDNENFERRIKRSINDYVLPKKMAKHHDTTIYIKNGESKAKEKVKWVLMKTMMKSKNSGKLYPNIPVKTTTIKFVN